MLVTKKVIHEISNYFKEDRGCEKGGILGSDRGRIINYFFPDKSAILCTANAYFPDVRILNRQIEKWAREEIVFQGIIHCHLTDTPELSIADRNYIEKILDAIGGHRKLYFPIVLYKEDIKIFSHCAQYVNDVRKVIYQKEKIEIVN